MIVIVAPYSPISEGGIAQLGPSRKVETIISILARLDQQLVLVNSAHNKVGAAPLKVEEMMINGVAVCEITPPLSENRTLGKLKNIFCVNKVLDVLQRLGNPQCFWFYNGYAFEMRMAEKAHRRFRVPLILEFEDWHFSRGRGLNPKPYIDYFFWCRAASLMSSAYGVNALLVTKMLSYIKQADILPGVVPKALSDIAKEFPPFSRSTEHINVGYFGGLSIEKGADIVLKLASILPSGYVVHVTGVGPLTVNFDRYGKEHPERLYYHDHVDDTTLYRLIAQCDVILNPHASIENMNNGVFPFKVIEAVASGRLLISTAVPAYALEDALEGVQFVQHNVDAFYSAIVTSRQYYMRHSALIARCSDVANQRFGELALLKKIKAIIN